MNKLKSDQIARDQLEAIFSTYSRPLLLQIFKGIGLANGRLNFLENEEIIQAILNRMSLQN